MIKSSIKGREEERKKEKEEEEEEDDDDDEEDDDDDAQAHIMKLLVRVNKLTLCRPSIMDQTARTIRR